MKNSWNNVKGRFGWTNYTDALPEAPGKYEVIVIRPQDDGTFSLREYLVDLSDVPLGGLILWFCQADPNCERYFRPIGIVE